MVTRWSRSLLKRSNWSPGYGVIPRTGELGLSSRWRRRNLRIPAAPFCLSAIVRKQAPMSYDVICFANRRWDALRSRPQQLMARAAADRLVLYVEPALLGPWARHSLSLRYVERQI